MGFNNSKTFGLQSCDRCWTYWALALALATMAFNFPASVAACLAAAQGFKVPRQLAMYCIAQDAGAPYMLYKDNMERTSVGGGGGGMPMSMHGGVTQGGGAIANGALVGAPTWGGTGGPHPENGILSPPGGGSYPVTATPSSPTDSMIQQNGDSPGSTPGQQSAAASVTVTVQTNQQQDQQHSITPPVPSPAYADQASQQTINASQQVNGDDDTSVVGAGGNQAQQTAPHSPAIQSESDQTDRQQQSSAVSGVCFPTDAAYYRGGGAPPPPPPPPPPHMLTTNSFMTYLKQQHQHQQQQQHNQQHHNNQQQGVVMLTQLQAADPGADFAANMPDLLAAQQNAKLNSKGTAHTDLRLFKCVTCGKDFKQKSTLLQHERIHTDSRPYPCGECGKRFRQQSHLTQHLRIHANEKPFACVYCERTFRQRAILNQHLRIHSGEKPFGCTQCGKRFRQKAILNQHIRTHQDVSPHLVYKNGQLWPQDLPFPSSDKDGGVYDQNGENCFSPESAIQFPAYFKDSKGMSHGVFGQGKVLPDIIQHGRSAGMPLYVRCPICQKEFKQKSTLLQHGCIHIESRPYPCGECGKRFRQQSHLTQHLRIHTNEKPYACVYCGRNFRQRTILNQHVRIHTGEKPYRCGQCGKDFRQKAILDQHTRTHQSDRPYCCPMPNCRRRFATEHEVKRHIDNHMNPHASKRRSTEVKHRPTSPLSPLQPLPPPPTIKPELYFPQCYVSTATPSPSPFSTHSPSPYQAAYSSSPHPAITPPAAQQQDFKPPTQLTAGVVQ